MKTEPSHSHTRFESAETVTEASDRLIFLPKHAQNRRSKPSSLPVVAFSPLPTVSEALTP